MSLKDHYRLLTNEAKFPLLSGQIDALVVFKADILF